MRIPRAIAALPIIFVLAACGSNNDVTQSSGDQTAKSADQGDSPSKSDTEDYFRAISQLDQDGLADDLTRSVPDSPAAAYVTYNSAVIDAVIDSGASEDDLPDKSFEKVDGGYKTCTDGKCAEWTKIQAQGDKISSFAVNGNALGEIILTGGKRTFQAGDLGSAQLIAAYESQQKDVLNVVLKVASKDADVSAGLYEAKYRSASGRQSTASSSDTIGVTELSADSNLTVILGFPRAELGGELTLPVYSSDYVTTRTVKIPVKSAD